MKIKNTKIIKTAFGIIIGIFLFIEGCRALNYIYSSFDAYDRSMFYSFNHQENIDMVFIGSSHVFCGINPNLVEEIIGSDSFILSSSGQNIGQSYYNLIEANRKYNIKQANIELFYVTNTGEYAMYGNDSSISSYSMEYYTFSPNKIVSAIELNKADTLIEVFFPFIRYREKLFDKDWILENINKKKTDNYRNYKYYEIFSDENGYAETTNNGGYICTRVYNPLSDIYKVERTEEEMHINDSVRDYMYKIIEYCKKNEIELVFWIAPMYITQTMSVNYDTYYNDINEICKDNNIKFWDFNLCKSEYLPIMFPGCYMDIGHLNVYGQNAFTEFMCKILTQSEHISNTYFYNSFEEKRTLEPELVYGMYSNLIGTDENGSDIFEIKVAATGEDKLEYKFTINKKIFLPDGGETESVTEVIDYGTAKSFTEMGGTYGTCELEVRHKGSSNTEYKYDFQLLIQ